MLAVFIASSGSAVAEDATNQLDTDALRAALVKQRAVNLKRFDQYRRKRIYPHNNYAPGELNVWKDYDGHLCAIATLVHESGNDDLVEATANDRNFVKLADETSGPLVDWILTSGLTQEEAVMIQQPTEEWLEAEERARKREIRREDRRLAKNYIAVERALEEPRITDAGLDVAVARLVARPELAAKLLAATMP
ncbi:MAG TPA: hypothetical protein VGG28_32795 [Kofleriaceae bacterium]